MGKSDQYLIVKNTLQIQIEAMSEFITEHKAGFNQMCGPNNVATECARQVETQV